MTTDIRAHRDHDLRMIWHSKSGVIYCQTCDLFMTNLHSVNIITTIDTVTIREDSA